MLTKSFIKDIVGGMHGHKYIVTFFLPQEQIAFIVKEIESLSDGEYLWGYEDDFYCAGVDGMMTIEQLIEENILRVFQENKKDEIKTR